MVAAIKNNFSSDIKYTVPEGGMFLWVTLPEGLSSLELFEIAIKHKVAFVPGNPFYTYNIGETNNLRLNLSCVDEATIEKGIIRLAGAINELVQSKNK